MIPLSKSERDAKIRISQRKDQMKLKGVRVTDFDVSAALVSRVINELQPNRKLRKQIARKLGLPYETVWPVD